MLSATYPVNEKEQHGYTLPKAKQLMNIVIF